MTDQPDVFLRRPSAMTLGDHPGVPAPRFRIRGRLLCAANLLRASCLLWLALLVLAPGVSATATASGAADRRFATETWVDVQISPAGALTRIDWVGGDLDPVPESFVKASAAAAPRWRLIPERLAGAPVGGSVVVPVVFEIDRSRGGARSRTLRFDGGSELHVHSMRPRRMTLSQFRLQAPRRAPHLVLQLAP